MIKEGSWDRIRKFELQIKDGTKWQNVATGTTVGASLELTFPPRTARYVRLNITEADEVPTILELELFETNK